MTLQDIKDIFPKMTKAQEEAVIALLSKQNTRATHPPKEIDGKTHYYCKYFDKYLPQEEIVFSNGKSKGYSKIGNSIWLKLNKDYDRLMTILFENDLEPDSVETIKNYMAWLKEAKNDSTIYTTNKYKELLKIDETIKQVQKQKESIDTLLKQIDKALK